MPIKLNAGSATHTTQIVSQLNQMCYEYPLMVNNIYEFYRRLLFDIKMFEN